MVLSDGQVAYWKFDGDATDATGNGYNGVVSGATQTTGKINNGYNFDGSDDKITIPHLNVVTTLSAWVKLNNNSTSQDYTIMNQRTSDGWYFQIDHFGRSTAGSLHVLNDTGTSRHFYSNNLSWTIGQWYHVVFILNGASSQAYRDGVAIGTSSNAIISTTSLYSYSTISGYIGLYGSVNVSDMNGVLDEVGVWNRQLSAAEVTELYNGGTGLQYPYSSESAAKLNALFLGGGF